MEWLLTILIFFAVMVLTAIVFGGWVIVSLAKLIYRALVPGHRREPAELTARPSSVRRCDRASCRAENPPDARFCRRCGRALTEAQRVTATRRAAML